MASVLSFTGTEGTAVAQRVAFDPAGNVFVVGTFSGTVDIDPGPKSVLLTSAGGNDVFVARLNASHQLIWARRFGGAGDDQVNALSISPAGVVHFGGRFEQTASFDSTISGRSLTSNGGADAFIGVFAANGALRWIDGYGGGQFDEVNSIGIQPDGNLVAVGSFDGSVDFDRRPANAAILTANNLNDVFVVNLSPAGAYRWVRQFEGAGYQYPRDVAVGSDGSMVVVGSFYGTVDFDPGPGVRELTATPGLTSAFIAKLDARGGLSWAGNLGGSMQFGESVALDAATNSVYVSGVAYGPTDFDLGAGTATKSFGGGRTFLAKYGPSGNHVWARTFTSPSIYGSFLAGPSASELTVDSDGRPLLVGSFSGTVDFDDGMATRVATAAGDEDVFLATWNGTTGALESVLTAGGSGADRGAGVAADRFGRLSVVGAYSATANFSAFAAGASRTSLGASSGFVAVFGNEAPSAITLSASSIAENRPIGSVVGRFSTRDPNPRDTSTYTLVSGVGSADNAAFRLVGSELRTATALNVDQKSTYSIRVRSTDRGGLFREQAFTVRVTDVPDWPYDLERGLVARYRFDGNAIDASGNGLTGTVNDAVATTDRFGNLTGALSFNGSSSWVQVPHNVVLNAFPITVSAWFQSTADNPGTIVAKYENATWSGWGMGVGNGGVQPNSGTGYYLASRNNAMISQYDGYPSFEAGQNLNDGTWHQLVMVVDQGSGRLYLDGVLADTQLWRGVPSATSASWPMYFGYYPHSYAGIGEANPYYSGAIDDVRIYGRALGSEEIGLLYATESKDQNQVPTGIGLSSMSIPEGAAAGTTVGTLVASDPDVGDRHVFTLVNGATANDNTLFTINGNQLQTAAALYATPRSSYTVRVRVTDAAGRFLEKDFTITVTPTPIQTFSYGFKHVNEVNADRYLISSTGMRKYSEWQPTPITYWGPAANGAEGQLVYRVDFTSPAETIRLKASSPTWNFYVEPGGSGRGVSAIEVSRDGQSWVSIRDNVTSRNWGADWSVDESLPEAVFGGTAIWVRMRFLVEGAPNTSYTVAQFARSTAASTENVFSIDATLRGANKAPTDIVLSASAIQEGNAVGAVVGLLSAQDPDGGDRHTFTLVNGQHTNDNALFSVVGRELRANASFNAESRTKYLVRIRATDAGGLSVERDVAITVTPAAIRTIRLSRMPQEGYARLVQGGIYLHTGETYVFNVRVRGNVSLQSTDHIPEFWGNGRIFDGVDRRSWVDGDWTYYEARVSAPVSGFYELKLALWSRQSLEVTDVSLRSLGDGTELVKNGRFKEGLAGWYTHGGTLTLV